MDLDDTSRLNTAHSGKSMAPLRRMASVYDGVVGPLWGPSVLISYPGFPSVTRGYSCLSPAGDEMARRPALNTGFQRFPPLHAAHETAKLQPQYGGMTVIRQCPTHNMETARHTTPMILNTLAQRWSMPYSITIFLRVLPGLWHKKGPHPRSGMRAQEGAKRVPRQSLVASLGVGGGVSSSPPGFPGTTLTLCS